MMYLLYVDESGDTGLAAGSSPYFVLSGLVVHELAWHDTLAAIIQFRRDLRTRYGLKLREEIHAARFFSKPGDLKRIAKHLRLRILRDLLDFQAKLPAVCIINVLVDKANKPAGTDIFDRAWVAMFQRFENTIAYRNFPGPRNPHDYGIVVVDRTEEKRLRNLSRRLRRYNPVPMLGGGGYRMLPLQTLIEDPVHRDSLHSYLIQLADVNAYFLFQKHRPNKFIRRKGARNYFDRLGNVLCRVASRTDPFGIVRL